MVYSSTYSIPDPPPYEITGVKLLYLARVYEALGSIQPGFGDIQITDVVICGGTGRPLGRFKLVDDDWVWEGK